MRECNQQIRPYAMLVMAVLLGSELHTVYKKNIGFGHVRFNCNLYGHIYIKLTASFLHSSIFYCRQRIYVHVDQFCLQRSFICPDAPKQLPTATRDLFRGRALHLQTHDPPESRCYW